MSLLFATLMGMACGFIKLRDVVPLLRDTMTTTGAIFCIAACAKVFVSPIALTGLSNSLAAALGQVNVGPWMFIADALRAMIASSVAQIGARRIGRIRQAAEAGQGNRPVALQKARI